MSDRDKRKELAGGMPIIIMGKHVEATDAEKYFIDNYFNALIEAVAAALLGDEERIEKAREKFEQAQKFGIG